MQSTLSLASDTSPNSGPPLVELVPPRDLGEQLRHALEHAAHLLPDQAPLEVFVHHNTLHALQHLPFHAALRVAHAQYGARVYREEAAPRRDLAHGRIKASELDRELDRYFVQRALDPAEEIGGLCSRRSLYALALRIDLAPPTRAALRWRVREEQFDRHLSAMSPDAARALVTRGQAYLREFVAGASRAELARQFLGPSGVPERMPERYAIPLDRRAILRELERDPEPLVAGSMWQRCRVLGRACPRAGLAIEPPSGLVHRDKILARTGVDVWADVHLELFEWAAAYLDEGLAYWPMPRREAGFYRGVSELLCAGGHVKAWLRRAARRFADLRARDATPDQAMVLALGALGVEPKDVEDYVVRLLRATPGFAGMFSRLERHPHERDSEAPPTSLAEFCAVRLVLEWAALEQAAVDHQLGDLRELEVMATAQADAPHPDAHAAYRLFIVAQKLELSPARLDGLAPEQAGELLRALDEFDELERGRVFLEAYERRYRTQILDAMRELRPADPRERVVRPSGQYVTCIDDREESFRRHIEEVDPRAETFGAAGSFGLAIDYRGMDAGGHISLAPVGVRPRHEIVECPLPGESVVSDARAGQRRRLGLVLHQFFFASRSGFRGALASLLLGPFAWLLSGFRVMAPRLSMRVLDRVNELLFPMPRTRLTNAESGTAGTRGLARGYTFEEQSDRVYALLESIGLRESFAPLVCLFAHGSTSLNNPHEAAYDCGACGGHRGGPTARLLASFANDPRVRAKVAQRGITIPDDTWFIAGEHGTSTDSVVLYDLDLVPAASARALAHVREVLDEARARNGHERARKFEMAALTGGVRAGLRHVEGRAAHLGESRPEYGHCTNAICIVGRRSLTRGLFLDRRAFLVSYDPEHDGDNAVLDRLMAIAGPVGVGINLEYYFSFVDSQRFGCGSKLPHNICAYVGVLNGTTGDLRTGLPQQMTEIHEPMRLLVIVEATTQALIELTGRQPIIAELVTRGWIQLVSVDPESGAMQLFEDGAFVACEDPPAPLPSVPSSAAYFAGSRDFLPPARVLAAFGGRS
jgi:hypothetical protein